MCPCGTVLGVEGVVPSGYWQPEVAIDPAAGGKGRCGAATAVKIAQALVHHLGHRVAPIDELALVHGPIHYPAAAVVICCAAVVEAAYAQRVNRIDDGGIGCESAVGGVDFGGKRRHHLAQDTAR